MISEMIVRNPVSHVTTLRYRMSRYKIRWYHEHFVLWISAFFIIGGMRLKMSRIEQAIEKETIRFQNLKEYLAKKEPTYTKSRTIENILGLPKDGYTMPKNCLGNSLFMKYYLISSLFGVWTYTYKNEKGDFLDHYDLVLNPNLHIMDEEYQIGDDYGKYFHELTPYLDSSRVATFLEQQVINGNHFPTTSILYKEKETSDGETLEQTVSYMGYSRSTASAHSIGTIDLTKGEIRMYSYDMEEIPPDAIEEILQKSDPIEPRVLAKLMGFYAYNNQFENRADFLDKKGKMFIKKEEKKPC